MKNTGGALVAKTLRRFGVKRLFTIPGHQTLSVLDGCLEEGITVVSTRHEAAAVHMAEGTSFATREPGVALLAGGPELTNGLTGLAKAFYANTPLLVVSGVNPPKKLDRGFPQDMNQLELVRPFTKWSRCCFDVIRIPEYLGAAFRHATSGRPGPVYLEIPYDVLEETVRDGSVRFPEPGTRLRPGGDEAALERARELLETAERPLAIAGSGVLWSGAEDELTTFAEKSGVPLYTTNAALTLPSPPELVTGLGSPAGGRPSLNAIAEADLILLFGTRVNFALGFGREPFMSDAQKLVQFDIDAAEIGAHRPIDVGVAGDLKATLTQFNQDLRITKDLESWKRRLSGEQESFEAALAPLFNSERVPIHPMRLVRELETARKPDSFLVLDGANS
ncbi:MAG: thiamine pyrophosphate-binding protein, partial [Trueperaceae bacterium]